MLKRQVMAIVGGMLGGAIFILGCSREHYQKQADKDVYQIIDDKWRDDFGTKANYRIDDPNGQTQSDVPSPAIQGRLPLAQAVKVATEHNRDYQRRKEQLYIQALRLTLARHRFSPQWFGLFSTDYRKSDTSESVGAGGGLGFNQLLADGTEISADIASDWTRYLLGNGQSSLGSVFSATVRRPLLRGSGKKIVQENLTQAERDTLYEIRDFNRYRQEFVVSIVNDYYDVLGTRDRIANEENNYQSLKLSYEQVKMLADAGRKPQYEVDQAEQQLLTAENRLLLARQDYKFKLDTFKVRLSLPTDAAVELEQEALTNLSQVGVVDPNFSEEDVTLVALEHRLDLINTLDQVVDAQRKVEVAADALQAGLTLTGRANADSRPQRDVTNLEFDRGDYSLGFELDLPLERTAERNAYRQSLIALDQRRRDYQQKVDNVKLESRQALRNAEESAQTYRIQGISVRLAQQRVDSTRMLLQAGRAGTRDLLEAQSALVNSQNATTAALVRHFINTLTLYRDMGILDVMPDGMWQEPTR